MQAEEDQGSSQSPQGKGQSPESERPDGSISSGIYDAVEKLTANGNMKRSAAFRQIAKESGRKEGTVAVNYYYVAKKRGGGRKAAAKAVKAAAPKAAGISATIYDAIEKLMAGGRMKRSDALRQHAKATGRKEGTAAVNYYYAAKKRGGGRKRGPGRPRMAVARRTGGGASSRLEAMLKALAELICTPESEIKLRRQSERFAAIRKLPGS